MAEALGEPTPERLARSAFISAPAIGTEAGQARAGARMYRALTTLERLLRDGAITPRQHDGGERFRNDFEVGLAGARDEAGSGGTAGWYYAEVRLRAVERYQLALKALGPLWRLTVPICVGDITISMLARALGRNRQEVAGCVKLGLDVLADAYELPQ